eukprot:3596060-Amphidinium_carterae.1
MPPQPRNHPKRLMATPQAANVRTSHQETTTNDTLLFPQLEPSFVTCSVWMHTTNLDDVCFSFVAGPLQHLQHRSHPRPLVDQVQLRVSSVTNSTTSQLGGIEASRCHQTGGKGAWHVLSGEPMMSIGPDCPLFCT